MKRRLTRGFILLGVTVPMLSSISCRAASATVTIPDPVVDAPLAPAPGQQMAVFAGGCFWGIQAVFEHVKGVMSATSGYSGGDVPNPGYELVSTGTTGHAESVKVVYDPSKITYGQLLKVFFSVAHDPTELNRQGPDVGTQYRSVIFYANEEQKLEAERYISLLDGSRAFSKPIVTQVVPLKAFYPAEDYHQHFMDKNPDYPYIVMWDAPKVSALMEMYPKLLAHR